MCSITAICPMCNGNETGSNNIEWFQPLICYESPFYDLNSSTSFEWQWSNSILNWINEEKIVNHTKKKTHKVLINRFWNQSPSAHPFIDVTTTTTTEFKKWKWEMSLFIKRPQLKWQWTVCVCTKFETEESAIQRDIECA